VNVATTWHAAVSDIIDAELVRTANEWADVIKTDLTRAVDGIVSAGRNLIAAKAEVHHGEWLPMLKQIGISETESKRLRAIAQRFGNRPNLDDLPTSPSALYELSRLDLDQIEDGIADGAITPDMTIKDARAFARPEPEPPKEPIAEPPVRIPAAEKFAHIEAPADVIQVDTWQYDVDFETAIRSVVAKVWDHLPALKDLEVGGYQDQSGAVRWRIEFDYEEFSSDAARQLAAALLEAADELDRRTGAGLR
jgi:hypothetical protein